MRKLVGLLFTIALIALLTGVFASQKTNAQEPDPSEPWCKLNFVVTLQEDDYIRVEPSVTWGGAIVNDWIDVYIDNEHKNGVQTLTQSGSHSWELPHWYHKDTGMHTAVAYINVINAKQECDTRVFGPPTNAGGGDTTSEPAWQPGAANGEFFAGTDATSYSISWIAGDGSLGGVSQSGQTDSGKVTIMFRNPGFYRLVADNGFATEFQIMPDGSLNKNPEMFPGRDEPEPAQTAVQQQEPTPVPTDILSPDGLKRLFYIDDQIWVDNGQREWDSGLRGEVVEWQENWVIVYINPEGQRCRGDQMGNIYSCEPASDTNA